MKKGISLIVLVITIIVMIIIAGAIIISLNSSNVIRQSNDAVQVANRAEANSILSMKYAEILAEHYKENPTETYKTNATDLAVLQKAVNDLKKDKDNTFYYTVAYAVAENDENGYIVVENITNSTAQ